MEYDEEALARVALIVAPGGRLVGVLPLTGGISAAMVVLEIERGDGTMIRVVLRQLPGKDLEARAGKTSAEFRLLRHLHQDGIPVPQAIAWDVSGDILAEPYLVLGYVAGQTTFKPANLEEFLRQTASQLAAMHRVDTAGLDFLPQNTGRSPEFGRDEPARGALNVDWGAIQPVMAAGPGKTNRPTLLHGDYWPGNLLWREGQLAAVVDWEDALLGDPLLDLAIARLELAWIFSFEAMARFTAAYQAHMAIDYTALPYWDLNAARRLSRLVGDDLAGWVSFFEPYGRSDISEDGVRAAFGRFLAEATG